MLTAKIVGAPLRSNGIKLFNKSPLKKYAPSRSFTTSRPAKDRVSAIGRRSLSKYGAGAVMAALIGGYGYYMYVTERYKLIPEVFERMKRGLSSGDENDRTKRVSELEQRLIPPVREPTPTFIPVADPTSDSGRSEVSIAPLGREAVAPHPNEIKSCEEKSDAHVTPAVASERQTNSLSEAKLPSDTGGEREMGEEEQLPPPSETKASVSPDKEVEREPDQRIPSDAGNQKLSPDPKSESPPAAAVPPEADKTSEHMRHMEEFGQAMTEEALSSEFPFVHGNTDPGKPGGEQLLAGVKRGFQRFMDSKDKLSENIRSQILETERVAGNPGDLVAHQSLDALESMQLEHEAEYGACRKQVLARLSQLGASHAAAADKYESMISSAHGEVSSSLQSLVSARAALQELKQRELSDRESFQLYTDKISHLQQELSRLRRESADSQEAMDRRQADTLSAAEGEAKRTMYQLIEAHHDHMATRLAEHTAELNREWSRILSQELEQARAKFQAEKSGVLVRLRGISRGIEKSESSLAGLRDFQAVRSLVDELQEFIDAREDTGPAKLFIRQRVVRLGQHLKGRPDMSRLLRQIPQGVLVHGLRSRRWLERRFGEVERSCWRLAYVQDGQGLTSYAASYLRSLLASRSSPLRIDGPKDLELLPHSNANVLRCARKCVQEGDLYNATLLMNNLRGVARTEASNWVRDTVSYLETEQVVRVLYWYLNASILAAAK